jgi:hypothetical protein
VPAPELKDVLEKGVILLEISILEELLAQLEIRAHD